MWHRTSLYLSIGAVAAGLAIPLATGVARSEKRPTASSADPAAAAAVGLRAAHFRAGARGIPLAFEVNRGQADPVVQYRARGEGFDLLLERDGIHLPLDVRPLPHRVFRALIPSLCGSRALRLK